jgi:hypothetical protein
LYIAVYSSGNGIPPGEAKSIHIQFLKLSATPSVCGCNTDPDHELNVVPTASSSPPIISPHNLTVQSRLSPDTLNKTRICALPLRSISLSDEETTPLDLPQSVACRHDRVTHLSVELHGICDQCANELHRGYVWFGLTDMVSLYPMGSYHAPPIISYSGLGSSRLNTYYI